MSAGSGQDQAERVAWTEPGSRQAFLFLDRNANGVVDNGTELFGNLTPQETSNAPNGFRALELLDRAENGGNSDGRISSQDAAFSHLKLWSDENHDGSSQPPELVQLVESGVMSIGLDYKTINKKDRFGNLFRYLGVVEMDSGKKRHAYDVFLQVAP